MLRISFAMGIVLVAAASVTAVRVRSLRRDPPQLEPMASRVLALLPGGNCGACDAGTCFESARAVATGRASASVCTLGGEATEHAIAALLARDGIASHE